MPVCKNAHGASPTNCLNETPTQTPFPLLSPHFDLPGTLALLSPVNLLLCVALSVSSASETIVCVGGENPDSRMSDHTRRQKVLLLREKLQKTH